MDKSYQFSCGFTLRVKRWFISWGWIGVLDNYDTTINVIGGLRDCDVIYRAIESHFSKKDL